MFRIFYSEDYFHGRSGVQLQGPGCFDPSSITGGERNPEQLDTRYVSLAGRDNARTGTGPASTPIREQLREKRIFLSVKITRAKKKKEKKKNPRFVSSVA